MNKVTGENVQLAPMITDIPHPTPTPYSGYGGGGREEMEEEVFEEKRERMERQTPRHTVMQVRLQNHL